MIEEGAVQWGVPSASEHSMWAKAGVMGEIGLGVWSWFISSSDINHPASPSQFGFLPGERDGG